MGNAKAFYKLGRIPYGSVRTSWSRHSSQRHHSWPYRLIFEALRVGLYFKLEQN